ncbi:MAG TPA: hypothetical protein VFJ90_06495 [Candidatus Didemnitutus sp.]|nr:hypothetical protein [Candidatus Didemnitutus sp.]
MASWIIAPCVVVVFTSNGIASAQSTGAGGISPTSSAVVLVDSTGKAAAKPLNESVVLVAIGTGVTAPASIRPIYGPDGRTVSGLATWQAAGSVLFTSGDCTTGANVYSSPYAGARAATQVQTPAGTILYAGAIGPTTTVSVQSVLYDTGCAPLRIQQNGLVPVVATLNLTTAYPPPLSFQ